MNRVTYLIARARRIRNGGAGPLIESAEAAREIAQEIAAALGALDESDRVLFYSNLADIGEALRGRMKRLKAEQAETGGELIRLGRGLSAARAYAAPRERGRRGGPGA